MTRWISFAFALVLLGCGPERTSYHGGQAGMTVEDPPDVHLDGDHIRIDDHIHFALDSAEILADSNQLLDHIAQFLGNHPEITAGAMIGSVTSRNASNGVAPRSSAASSSDVSKLTSRDDTTTET